MSHTRTPRILFITIGQSPRPDLMEGLTSDLPQGAEITEMGLLDGLDASEIRTLMVEPGHHTLVTSLSDGSPVLLSRAKTGLRASQMIADIPAGSFDLIVLLSTGIFRDLESTCPTVNAQRAVEAAIISVASQGESVGIIYPLRQQAQEVDIPALALFDTHLSHGNHGNAEELARAAHDLGDCAYIVFNSVGYTENDRRLVSDITGKTVILSRRIIASSIRMILGTSARPRSAAVPDGLQSRLNDLTDREKQVMSLVCEGLSSKAVARQLDISHKTVEIHRSNIMRKLDMPSSGALIRLLVRAGVV